MWIPPALDSDTLPSVSPWIPAFPVGHLHIEALNAATPFWLLGETSAHSSTGTDTHVDPPSSWAQKLALPQQECPSHPCLMHTCTNGVTINSQTAQTLWKLTEIILTDSNSQPTDPLVFPGSILDI